MAKRKPNYEGNGVGAQPAPVTFNEKQAAILNAICAHPNFSGQVQEIANTYVTVKVLHKHLSTDADNVATMADLEILVSELRNKLWRLPPNLEKYLYKFEEKMPVLKLSLFQLEGCIWQAKRNMPKPKTKSHSAGPERQAAEQVQELFKNFGLPFVGAVPVRKGPETAKIWAAGECMKMVFECGKVSLGDHAISGYIKGAKNPVAPKMT